MEEDQTEQEQVKEIIEVVDNQLETLENRIKDVEDSLEWHEG